MTFRDKALSDLMDSVEMVLESNFEKCDHDGEMASKETVKDLKRILEKFGFKVEFVESAQED